MSRTLKVTFIGRMAHDKNNQPKYAEGIDKQVAERGKIGAGSVQSWREK
jgi:hypothetical protein